MGRQDGIYSTMSVDVLECPLVSNSIPLYGCEWKRAMLDTTLASPIHPADPLLPVLYCSRPSTMTSLLITMATEDMCVNSMMHLPHGGGVVG